MAEFESDWYGGWEGADSDSGGADSGEPEGEAEDEVDSRTGDVNGGAVSGGKGPGIIEDILNTDDPAGFWGKLILVGLAGGGCGVVTSCLIAQIAARSLLNR